MKKKNEKPETSTPPNGYVAISDFARSIGKTRYGVALAVQEGRIISAVRIGRRVYIDPVAGKAELTKNTQPIGGDWRKGRAKNMAEGSEEDYDEKASETASIHALRRQKLQIENAIKVQQLKEITGVVIEKQQAEARLFSIGQMFRMRLQQLPAAVVDAVMSARTRNAAIIVLEDAISDALNALADELEKGL